MPERLTDEQLREIEARANAATPGPWRLWDREIAPRRITDGSGDISALLDTSEDAEGFNREEDACFVAHARADLPALLAEIQALREERDRALGQSEELIQNVLPRVEALESGDKRGLELARKTAALEALQIVGEEMRMRWELSREGSNREIAAYNLACAVGADSLQDQIIQHFQLPPTARVEVDEDKRPVPPNLLENAS